MARVDTSVGRSSGQQGSEARLPMTTSAAWGSPVQQAGLTETIEAVPTLSTATNPTSASFFTWWEHVDWLMPNASARSPTRIAPERDVDTVCSSRTRVESARTANQSAYVAAERSSSSAARLVGGAQSYGSH